MDPSRILPELSAVASEPDFDVRSSDLADEWTAAGAGLDAVEPVLRFMEGHPDLEYGAPGGLVHFVERFHRKGYEQFLLDSVLRRPTWITTWMLNRLLNGATESAARQLFLQAMERAQAHPKADPRTVDQLRRFLVRAR